MIDFILFLKVWLWFKTFNRWVGGILCYILIKKCHYHRYRNTNFEDWWDEKNQGKELDRSIDHYSLKVIYELSQHQVFGSLYYM